MKVLVTGATGFTGSYLVPLLLQQGLAVRCFIRPASKTNVLPVKHLELIQGDLADSHSLQAALSGVEALVNLASLGFGHAEGIVAAAVRAGIRRAVFISTTAIFTRLDPTSKSVRRKAEETIENSGLAYTILRPTMIYGSSRDRNMCRLIRYLQRWPVIPVFGGRNSLQQPVYVADVADAVSRSLQESKTMGKSYNIPGGSALTLDQIISTICCLMKWRVRRIRLPTAPIVAVLTTAERLSVKLPIKAEQILRLNEDKSFDFPEASQDFGYAPRSFDAGIALELRQLGLLDDAIHGDFEEREEPRAVLPPPQNL